MSSKWSWTCFLWGHMTKSNKNKSKSFFSLIGLLETLRIYGTFIFLSCAHWSGMVDIIRFRMKALCNQHTHHTSLWQTISLLDSECRRSDHLKQSALSPLGENVTPILLHTTLWTMAKSESQICPTRRIMTNESKFPFCLFSSKRESFQ